MFIALSGFLFIFIIVVLNLASGLYGYEIFSDLDAEAKLQKIVTDPQKFKTAVGLVVIEHFAIGQVKAAIILHPDPSVIAVVHEDPPN